jgi:hypothetical protein
VSRAGLGGRHFGVTKHLWPIGKGQIGGDQQRRVLIELADQVEQQLAAGLTERQVAEFVDDNEIVAQQLLGPVIAISRSYTERGEMGCV